MKLKANKRLNIFERWSFAVPVLCYLTFFSMIWILSVPLKSSANVVVQDDLQYYAKQKLEDTFEIKMKNSNFNSDRDEGENQLLNVKGEYLVNLNNNIHVDPSAILEDVFKRSDIYKLT